MISFPRLFSRLMQEMGPEFQTDILSELLQSYVEALREDYADARIPGIIENWLTDFEQHAPDHFVGKGSFFMKQLMVLSERISSFTGVLPAKSQPLLDRIQAYFRHWIRAHENWVKIDKKEKLPRNPPAWFKHFAGDPEITSLLLAFAGRYEEYKKALQIPQDLDKDPLYLLSRHLESEKALFKKLLGILASPKFEAYYIVEQLPALASLLDNDTEAYELLLELADKVYTEDYPDSFTFQQMIAKPYFKKEDIRTAIQLADMGLDPASLFATLDEGFRVIHPQNSEDIENLKIRFLDMLYRIHDNKGSLEENQLILEATLLSFYLADPMEVAKAFKLEGLQKELWLERRVLFPYIDIPENHAFMEFLIHLPRSHLQRILTIVLAPHSGTASNYAGIVYLPMSLSVLEKKDKAIDLADLTHEISQSLFEGMDTFYLKEWNEIQNARDLVQSPSSHSSDQLEYTSSRSFFEIYAAWIHDPDSIMLQAAQDPLFRMQLEMMAEHFVIRGENNMKSLRFYIPQYDVHGNGKNILLQQSMGIKTPYLGLTPVDIPIRSDAVLLWPVILKAYRELMDDTLEDELEAAYQRMLSHGPNSDKNFSYDNLDESLEIHQDINRAIQNGQAIALNASILKELSGKSLPENWISLLGQEIRGMEETGREKLSALLSSKPQAQILSQALQFLNQILQKTASSELQNRRFVILMTSTGPFAQASILAHAGYQEKTTGKPQEGTIYLHINTLRAAMTSPELSEALLELLKHENNDLAEKRHLWGRPSENIRIMNRLWLALQSSRERVQPKDIFISRAIWEEAA